MSNNKRKFKDVWCNQTDIGKLFGLSAIKVGNLLIEHGLKDSITKKATEKAIQDGFAKETPLKDGTYFCMWNKHQIKSVFAQEIKPLTEEQKWINDALTRKKQIDYEYEHGSEKAAMFSYDCFYDEIPIQYREKIRELIEKE